MSTTPRTRNRFGWPISLRIPDQRDSEPNLIPPTAVESSLCERFGLRENPFGSTPDPRYLYQTVTHREALSSLRVGIECDVGFQALVAAPGMGKTTLLFHLLSRLKALARTAFLFQIQADSREFLQNVLHEMGGESNGSNLVNMQQEINQLLVSQARAGKRTILVIDEAQSLETPVLETIRMLSNFELSNKKLLQVILAGQPQLAETLRRPELAQLCQRIWILTRIAPLGMDDVKQYVAYRLRIAGYGESELFSEQALRFVWRYSGGTPRNVNRLCFNALLAAAALKCKRIDADLLQEVAADLDFDLSNLSVPSKNASEHSAGSKDSSIGHEHSFSQSGHRAAGENGLEEVVERIRMLTGVEALAIVLQDGEEMVCKARAGRTAPDLGSSVDVATGLTGECIRSGNTLRCDDSENDNRVNRQACRQLDVKSVLAVPLRDGEYIIGVLEIYSAQTNAFTSLDVSLLQKMAIEVVATRGRAVDRTSQPSLVVDESFGGSSIAVRPGDAIVHSADGLQVSQKQGADGRDYPQLSSA
jgi:general secretion pathway protein A